MTRPATTIKATAEQAEALRRLALDLSAKVGRRLSLGAVMRAAVTVAERHPDELAAAIPPDSE